MNIIKIEKAVRGVSLAFYDSNLKLLESESFNDLSTLNFHLQTLSSKYKIPEGLLIVHDKDANTVEISLARGDNAFFVS